MTKNQTANILYIVCGRPGVGKTTYAAKLAGKQGAVVLDIDTVTEPMVRAGLKLANLDSDDRDSQKFKSAFRQPIHDALFATAAENLAINPVVIVAPFSREIGQADWLDWLRDTLSPETQIHYLTCDKAQIRERLSHRSNPRDQAKIEDWESYSANYTDSVPVFEHILVDTTNQNKSH